MVKLGLCTLLLALWPLIYLRLVIINYKHLSLSLSLSLSLFLSFSLSLSLPPLLLANAAGWEPEVQGDVGGSCASLLQASNTKGCTVSVPKIPSPAPNFPLVSPSISLPPWSHFPLLKVPFSLLSIPLYMYMYLFSLIPCMAF